MKVLTPQQENEHYRNVLKGGWGGLIGGTAAGSLGVWAAGKRYHAVRNLCPAFRAFLAIGTGGFAAIIYADRYSRSYEATTHPDYPYTTSQATLKHQLQLSKPRSQRISEFLTANKYRIVLASWAISMATAFAFINRKPYMTRAQKLVQARVYAQYLTLGVVVASVAVEGEEEVHGKEGQGVRVLDEVEKWGRERYPGQNRWMDMVAASERRMKEQELQWAGH